MVEELAVHTLGPWLRDCITHPFSEILHVPLKLYILLVDTCTIYPAKYLSHLKVHRIASSYSSSISIAKALATFTK